MSTDGLAPEIDLTKVVPASPLSRWLGALAGLVAGAVAVTVGMLVAGIIDVTSPIDAVGSTFIDHVPGSVANWAKEQFGTDDKLVLRIGIFIVLGLIAAVLGALSVRRARVGVLGILAFGVVGMLAAINRPHAPSSSMLPPVLGAIIGAALLVQLVRPPATGPSATPHRSRVPLGWDRRRFLVATGVASAVAVAAGTSARALERRNLEDQRDAIPDSIPPADSTVPALQPSSGGNIASELDSVTPFITPNDDFYRIDTALSFPRVDLDSWKLTIKGMVGTPLSFTYAELNAMPQVERVITLTCVSNEVGGDLIGNATWQGVLLKPLLERAGVDPAAEQVFSTSLDGWNCGFPVAVALDGRDAMIAIGMNGAALPLEHGFPARLVIPGLYGYVANTKWLDRIELNRWSDAEGYWVPLGWSRDGPIKTHSRIDVPKRGDEVRAGVTKLAGVAWAQHRGVAKVEVSVDGGTWTEATLSDDVSDDAWRQWSLDWTAVAGKHKVQVRATDNDGATQTEDVANPAPNGATGYHTRTITVS